MDNTINGRTPEEIKKGLECCSQNTYTCGEGCPYEVECQRMGRSNDVILDALAYINQLERERDEAQEENDLNNAAITALEGALDAMKREHDAAVEDMRNILGTGLCFMCQNRYLPEGAHRYACKEIGEFREDHNPTFCGKFKWRGVPQEVQHGTE